MVRLQAGGAHLINMSVGTITGDGQPPFALQRAVERLRDEVVLVAAVGNIDVKSQEPPRPMWPAALPGVLAVGSVNKWGATSTFSPQEPLVQLAAVGENVSSAFTTGDVECVLDGGGTQVRHFWGTAIWSGTSFSAALVTGRLTDLACKELARRRAAGEDADPVGIIRDLAEKLRTGQLADDVVRQP
jgi:subtilisin family serine protease